VSAATRARALLAAAVVANLLGWVLPVVDDYRGVHAFRVALSPIWPYEQFHIPPGRLVWLSVASAATNAVFVAVAAAVILRRIETPAARKLAVWIVGAAALLNLHWPLSMGANRADLEIGYFVWILSFLLLLLAVHPAVAAARRRR
jgi:hypothetical protein